MKVGTVLPTSYPSESLEAHVGDTLHKTGEKVDPVEGFLLMKPMVR